MILYVEHKEVQDKSWAEVKLIRHSCNWPGCWGLNYTHTHQQSVHHNFCTWTSEVNLWLFVIKKKYPLVWVWGTLYTDRRHSGMLGTIHSYSAHSAWRGKQLLQLHGSPRTEVIVTLSLKTWDIIPSDLIQSPIAHVGNVAWTWVCKANSLYVEEKLRLIRWECSPNMVKYRVN